MEIPQTGVASPVVINTSNPIPRKRMNPALDGFLYGVGSTLGIMTVASIYTHRFELKRIIQNAIQAAR